LQASKALPGFAFNLLAACVALQACWWPAAFRGCVLMNILMLSTAVAGAGPAGGFGGDSVQVG
jgi:hypothetical protein